VEVIHLKSEFLRKLQLDEDHERECKSAEGDVFRIVVPLDEEYSYDFGQDSGRINRSNQSDQSLLTEEEQRLLDMIKEYPDMTNALLAQTLGWSVSRVKYYVQKLKKSGKIKRKGTSRNGSWKIL